MRDDLKQSDRSALAGWRSGVSKAVGTASFYQNGIDQATAETYATAKLLTKFSMRIETARLICRLSGLGGGYERRARKGTIRTPSTLAGEESLKRWAHVATASALRRGLIERQPCEVCGVEQSDAHHDDYARPMAVRWLCRKHHKEAHRAAEEVA